MRKGFTILELLVASLLLGMLMTILTMIFSQSSIAWRTGMAGAMGLNKTRATVSDVRYRADNAYFWDNQPKCVRSVFDDSGEIRTDRQVGDFESVEGSSFSMSAPSEGADASESFKANVSVPSGTPSSSPNYVINVMSCGPDRKPETRYDNIYSLPDDPNNW